MGWLAIAQNEKYQLLSESNRVQLIPVPPRRGWIIDRNGKPIAINKASFRVDLIPQQIVDGPRRSSPSSQQLLEPAAGRSRADHARARALARIPAGLGRRQCPLRAICRDHGAPARASRALPRRAASPASIRAGSTVGQLVGYVGAASAAEYEKENKNPLLLIPGVKIGKEGLEKTLEPTLRGEPGRAAGRGHRARQAGQGARPQARPQRRHRPADDRCRPPRICGAADRRPVRRRSSSSTSTNGDILAMPSMPSFDPTTSPTGSARTSGRCCRGTTICRWSIRRWRAFIRPARRSSRRWRWRC